VRSVEVTGDNSVVGGGLSGIARLSSGGWHDSVVRIAPFDFILLSALSLLLMASVVVSLNVVLHVMEVVEMLIDVAIKLIDFLIGVSRIGVPWHMIRIDLIIAP
jgi:hypothetical protein